MLGLIWKINTTILASQAILRIGFLLTMTVRKDIDLANVMDVENILDTKEAPKFHNTSGL